MPKVSELQIKYLPLSAVVHRTTNPRTHSEKQIGQIARSIERFGFTNPIIIDGTNSIVAGHGRALAAKKLGMAQLPVIQLATMSEADVRAYIIADNKLAENAGWDKELLGLEFQYLSELEMDFDLTLTGFEIPEIDILINDLTFDDVDEDKPDPADAIPDIQSVSITRLGDVWNIGPHRLICGDSLKRETYESLLKGQKAEMVFTDPPYNVPIAGHVSGLGGVQHREFAMGVGEMTSKQFTAFLAEVFEHLVTFSKDGAIHFQCMDWRHMKEMLEAGGQRYTEFKNLCVWAKNNGGMGSLYRSQHEMIFVFKSGTGKHINNVELGKHGRYRTNVWNFPGVNSFGSNRDDLALHPTVKPVAMVAEAIRDCSNRKGIVLDAFTGSGSTLVAAQKTGRWGYGIELDPLYCDVIIRRMQTLFKLTATLEGDGRTFDELTSVNEATDGKEA